ncbi:hypothetical protein [Amycolatopsis cihanbeyliensis]|uniref:Uncharacterized protein n=1 Tax=Amycolatopsis cihanbeyliensis TaxID=1128664 RepID=A0A542DMT6_AMYCI|nr:hypothetical protein [Amycolatopsis cihanbeyliensis]TQJ04305.1 hypothetical protein FB471_4091 [Amycolatopsis cihanbeyliensis]
MSEATQIWSHYLEDFRVGQHGELGNTTITTSQPSTVASLATVTLLVSDQGVLNDLRWSFHAPVRRGDRVRLTATVTRCRAGGDGWGLLHRHLVLAGQDDTVLGDGTGSFTIPTRQATPDERHVRTDFGSVAWAELLCDTLERNEDFVSATRPMDGTLGFRCGDEEAHIRVYKGRIVEVGRSTPTGPTFTVAGSELAWAELAGAPRNDFIARTMTSQFYATGNAHEYVRFTKAVVSAWDSIRELAHRDAVR